MLDIDCKETEDWPGDIIGHEYERIRPLGKGAYGIVWLAKAKNANKRPEPIDNDNSNDSGEKEDTFDLKHVVENEYCPPYVAIKQINAVKEGEKHYAAREIAILSEINHPNVVRCLKSMEMPRSRLVVLTLADGPDLNDLVEAGGALSVSLCRLAARHLISAVAYLHARGK